MALIFDTVELTGSVQIGNTSFTPDGSSVRHNTAHGYIAFGPANTSHAHIQTDRSNFYFNTEIRVNTGIIGSYDEDLKLRRAGSDKIVAGENNIYIKESAVIQESWGQGDHNEQLSIVGSYPSMAFRNNAVDHKWLFHHDGNAKDFQFYEGDNWDANSWTRRFALKNEGYFEITKANGTLISTGATTDAFGYNSNYGHYIAGNGGTYVYGNGSIYDGTANRTILHSANYNSYTDNRYLRRWKGTSSGVDNTGYTTVFTVAGDNLSSSIRFSVQGTTSSVVVANLIDLVVNHSQDIMIKAQSGVYTRLYVKVVSNNNEDFAVELKTNSANAVTLNLEVFTYGDETVTFTNSHSFTGASLEHDCVPGYTYSGTGGAEADIKTNGDISAGGKVFVGTGGGNFYNDLGSRVRINHDFYTNNSNTYLYATNLYLGDGSGDNINVRGNYMSGNNWSINSSGHFRSTLYYKEGSTAYYVNPDNVNGFAANLRGDVYIKDGRIIVKRGTGWTTTGWEDDSSANGRAQLILDSHYSDLIIASRNNNTNKHGSTLTLATQSTSTGDYAKWVVGQGQYQEGADILAFAYGTNDTNPHNTLGTDNANAVLQITSGSKMQLGKTGASPQFTMMFNDSGSGAGWDTAIITGKSDDLEEGTGFPAYIPAGSYGTLYKANSDGVFFGLEEYSSGNYRPIIQWGDDNTDSPFRIKHENGSEFTVSYDGHAIATSSLRAPIFYDSANTAYYVDPAATGKAAHLRGDIEIYNEAPVIEMNDYDATNTTNLISYVSFQAGSQEKGYVGYGTGSNNYLYLSNYDGRILLSGSLTEAYNQVRSPVFYDSANTAYYADPEGRSNFAELKVRGGYGLNYADSSLWTISSGSQSGLYGGSFSQNGDGNSVAYDIDPFGNRTKVWRTRNNDTSSNADGGWNKNISGLDPNKTYISVVYIKRSSSSTNGSFYHGCSGSHTLNMSGSANTNPYFSSYGISGLPEGRWCVSIGVIHANNSSSTANTGLGGLYDVVTGEKLRSYSDFKMKSGSTEQTHRTYLYYSTDPNAALDWWGPGFYEAGTNNNFNINNLLRRGRAGGRGIFEAEDNSDTTLNHTALDLRKTGSGNSVGIKFTTGNSQNGLLYVGGTGELAYIESLAPGQLTKFIVTPTSRGRVGIGGISPSYRLHIYDGDGLGQCKLGNQASVNTTIQSGVTLALRSSGAGGSKALDIEGQAYGLAASMYIPNYSVGMTVTNGGSFSQNAFNFVYGSSNVGSIRINSSSTSYNTTSDYRLKENVTPITGAIERLNQLNPSRFTWINDPEAGTVDGFIAHEVSDVVPEAVSGEKDGLDYLGMPEYQGIDQSKLVPLLTAALQEAITKIENLENRLQVLENQ